MMNRLVMVAIATACVGLSVGCGALRTTPIETPLSRGVEMVEDANLQKVYLKPGVNFSGHDALVVAAVSTAGVVPLKELDPDEMGVYFRHILVKELAAAGIFQAVSDDPGGVRPTSGPTRKVLILNSTFSDLDPGNRALRYFVSFGAGRTKVQVETEIRDAETKELLFKSSNRRVGAMGAFGGDTKGFITESLDAIAADHAAFMKRIKTGGGIKPPSQ